jgi:hypothetical protein
VDEDGNINLNKHFHTIIMLFPENKIKDKLELEIIDKLYVDIIKRFCKEVILFYSYVYRDFTDYFNY